MTDNQGDPKEIDLQKRGDISRMVPPEGERRQPMRGFDDRFVDIVDYIVFPHSVGPSNASKRK